LPIEITIEDIKNKYFKDKRIVKIQKIHPHSEVGVINALWANELAQGGVLPLQVSFIPSNKFLDLTLTGSLGDVMKESMNYALRIAYNMLTEEEQNKILTDASNKKTFGLLIHTPEAATKKDGPSAGIAISLAIYSVLTGKKIKNNV
jgi:ATP-dependent Lon protease